MRYYLTNGSSFQEIHAFGLVADGTALIERYDTIDEAWVRETVDPSRVLNETEVKTFEILQKLKARASERRSST